MKLCIYIKLKAPVSNICVEMLYDKYLKSYGGSKFREAHLASPSTKTNFFSSYPFSILIELYHTKSSMYIMNMMLFTIEY